MKNVNPPKFPDTREIMTAIADWNKAGRLEETTA